MPSPVSQMPRTAGAAVRVFLHRAAFFWRGAAGVSASVFGVLLVVAFTVPEVYESEALIAFAKPAGSAVPPQDDAVLADRLHAAVLDLRTLERVARGLTPVSGNPNAVVPGETIDRVRQSIEVHPRGDQKFAISFRAGTAAYAQHGCQELAQLAVQHLEAMAAASSPAAEEAAKRAKALEEKTRELAAFVAAHPDVAMNRADGAAKSTEAPASSSNRSSPPASSDTALVVLQQERGKLEARLAEAERQKAASGRGEGNPYDPPADDDAESLRQMIVQVKAAIATRQSAVAREHHDDSTSGADKKPPAAASSAPSSPAIAAEWQRLVQALLEAQSAPAAKREASPTVSLVQPAGFPSSPIKPNRPVLALVGFTSGLWMGVLWAFARVALGHDLPSAPASPILASRIVAEATVAEAARSNAEAARPFNEASTQVSEGVRGGAVTLALPQSAGPNVLGAAPVDAIVEERPAKAGATPSTPPTKENFWRPPLRLRVTQRGVIDLAAVLAHTGTAAAGTMPTGVNASPIVGVGDGVPSDPAPPEVTPTPARVEPVAPRRPAPLPNARTLVGYLGPEVRAGASRPPSDAPPAARSDPPARPRSDPPPRARSDPPAQARSDPPGRPRSDPPARPRSDPPARPRSDPPARPRSDPPARPRSDPPIDQRIEPPPQQRAPSDAPDGVIVLRDVPSGWSPDPSIAGSDSVEELRAIREQLYRFAVRGCFVVGVTSSPDAVDGKSRMAARLASALAEPGRARVLLMEGDFDGPSVHRLMRIEMPLASGFSEQVRRRMKGPSPSPWSIVRCSPSLQVLAEGRVRAPGILSSVQFMDGIAELRRYYDVIVLDGPMAGSVDARVLDQISDGLVIVGPNEAAMPEVRRQASQWFSKKGWMATLPAAQEVGSGTT